MVRTLRMKSKVVHKVALRSIRFRLVLSVFWFHVFLCENFYPREYSCDTLQCMLLIKYPICPLSTCHKRIRFW